MHRKLKNWSPFENYSILDQCFVVGVEVSCCETLRRCKRAWREGGWFWWPFSRIFGRLVESGTRCERDWFESFESVENLRFVRPLQKTGRSSSSSSSPSSSSSSSSIGSAMTVSSCRVKDLETKEILPECFDERDLTDRNRWRKWIKT